LIEYLNMAPLLSGCQRCMFQLKNRARLWSYRRISPNKPAKYCALVVSVSMILGVLVLL
jgi:hypothetical protein